MYLIINLQSIWFEWIMLFFLLLKISLNKSLVKQSCFNSAFESWMKVNWVEVHSVLKIVASIFIDKMNFLK